MAEKFFTVEECRRKANQCYEMAGLARADGDSADAARQLERAQQWDQRAKEGGATLKIFVPGERK